MRKLLLFVSALALTALHLSAAVPPPDKLLPDNTLVVATIPDFNNFQTVVRNSSQGQLWNDPSMAEFKAKFWGKLKQQYLVPLERNLSVSLNDYTNLLHGQITLAVTADGWLDKSVSAPGLLLLVDVKDGSYQLKTNLSTLKQKWIDMGKTVKTERIRDIDFSMITISPSDFGKTSKSPDAADAPSAKNSIYIGQADSLLIIGNSTAAIEKVLSRMSGGSVKSVSDLATFAANAPLFHDSPMYAWINSAALVEMLNRQFSQSADSDASRNAMGYRPDKVLSATGLSGLRSIALSYQYNREGAAFALTLSAPEATRTGLLKILAGEPKDSTPPPFVPADVIKFQRIRLDGQKTYKTIRKMLSDASPSAVGMVDYALGAAEAVAIEKDPDFTFNKDLFGQLGDDVIIYQKAPHSDNLADLNSGPSLFLIASPNPEKLASALKNILVIFNISASAITEKDFLGHKVYSLALPTPAAPAGKKSPPRAFTYAANAGYLAITSDPLLLEEFLRSSEKTGKSLRDVSGLSDAIQKVSTPGTFMLGYGDDTEVSRFTFDALKHEAGSTDPLASLAPLTSAMGMSDIKVSDWIDLSLLPPFSKVSKYFYFSVYSGSASSDDITFKFYAPMPPQLRK